MYEPKFDISQVADLLGLERLSSGNSFGVVCPFCGDRRGKMNFRIRKGGEPANTYQCFHCGAKGNMLTLYADVQGIFGVDRYKIAYREIIQSLGFSVCENRTEKQQITSYQEEPLADDEQKSQVYEQLLAELPLSEKHRNQLLNRGLNPMQIEAFQFRSTPTTGTEGIARRLIRAGCNLSGVPGFYVNDRNNWDMAFYPRNQGIICPVMAPDRKISGFQIRLDSPYDGRKYLWFSSANKNRGTGSKSPAAFFGNPYDRTIRVTEGVLKASVANALSGYSFIGVPGVNQYKALEAMLIRLKENGLVEVQEYMDMDKCMSVVCDRQYKTEICSACEIAGANENHVCPRKLEKRNQIQEGCKKLYEICGRLDLHCISKRWDMDKEGVWSGHYKGIDDFWWEQLKKRRECNWKNEPCRIPAA